jgi:hypothetical protein
METVCIIVGDKPENLKQDEMFIPELPYVDAVSACGRHRGGQVVLRVNYLRALATEVGRRYDKTFNPFRNVVPSDFDGTSISSDEDVAGVLKKMFDSSYPQIYTKYVESAIKDRPYGVHKIYIGETRFETSILAKLGVRLVAEYSGSPVCSPPDVAGQDVAFQGNTEAPLADFAVSESIVGNNLPNPEPTQEQTEPVVKQKKIKSKKTEV